MDNCNLHGAEPIQFGGIVPGVFNPALAKHSKSFSLIDCISVAVDRMQRNFEPIRKQVEAWQRSELTDVTFKVVIYEGFLEDKLEAPKHLARSVPGPPVRAVQCLSRGEVCPSIAGDSAWVLRFVRQLLKTGHCPHCLEGLGLGLRAILKVIPR
jgi:hypothetical protein